MIYPNWFKTVEGNFYAVLYPLQDQQLKMLQIGAYTGDATQWLLDNITTNPNSTITDVDTWEGSDEPVHKGFDWKDVETVYTERHQNSIDSGRLTKNKMSSDKFFAGNTEFYDFIYIDGDHTAKQTFIDAENAFMCLKSGGILAFDDYEWNLDPKIENRPKPGVDRFLHKYKDELNVIIRNYQLWITKI
jgi:predicted O-methyltransferase YrrM